MQLLVYREKSRGERKQPWGEPVLMYREAEAEYDGVKEHPVAGHM